MTSLFVASAVYGVIAVLVFRRFTERTAIRRSVNRILAHVMELGLFLDSPGLVLGAQRDLLRENLRLLRLVLVPGIILAVLCVPMYAFYSHGPLTTGETSVVTIQLKDDLMPEVRLEAPEGIAVETPGVRILHDHQISWRVRALRESSGEWKFHVEDRVVPAGFFVRDAAIRSVEIRYPTETVLGFSWLVWFVATSSVSAVLFGLFWK
jgi:hypothetical protein